ncbi:hypothetical protein NSQ82_01575 [Caldifermentibacillus hisashii]|uniref:hypothetical protein n=1 Tax=Caldifermentibacillus hisashii TaxID=996558 RepID=UPI001FD07AD8
MGKFIKLIYLTCAFLIMGTFILGILTKKSFKENTLDLNSKEYYSANVSLQEDEESSFKYFNNNIKNLDELVNNSDLIVIGSVDKERLLYNSAIKTKFIISDVIRNNSEVTNLPNKIFIFEPSYFNFDTYFIKDGYNIMQNNAEYIVFLKHLEKPTGYEYKNDEMITFIPVSTYYGKFELKNVETTKVISSSQTLTYQDIKSQSIVTENQKIIDTYNNIKSELGVYLK